MLARKSLNKSGGGGSNINVNNDVAGSGSHHKGSKQMGADHGSVADDSMSDSEDE